jgi:hypothetical protein
MPELSEISYSRNECIIAVRDYYAFLAQMYVKDSEIIEPPQGGWPSVTTENLQLLDKSDEVVELLRYLPYMREHDHPGDAVEGAPRAYFADWQSIAERIRLNPDYAETARVMSEVVDLENVPPPVIGLIAGENKDHRYMVDTNLGTIHWPEYFEEITDNTTFDPILDEPEDYAPENEVEWRQEGTTWALKDFFEMLKEQFRTLHFVPLDSRTVVDDYLPHNTSDGTLAMIQDIYREHGWPNLDIYQKENCLRAIRTGFRERFPDSVLKINLRNGNASEE